ncbi:phosphoribosylanthranilate isomerase [Synechococcus sp. MW101C3]|jgi:phosphoribosylanthranilate isomerase|uniref:phosphoribosylanthranilate isomerase n=1 Tax=Synechococcus sp. MW101C3 TaxID=210768 RepID=UPI000B99CB7A|nr:phosphoribosylanthranilate isomerase [Synechococcus sp. MW101C3]
MTPLLKICGLRSPDQAYAVAALGVEAIGVIAVPGSPRWLEPQQRAAVFSAARQANPACLGVLVVADPEDAIQEQLDPLIGGHQLLQLHGNETPERCRMLSETLGCQVWKALRIRSPEDLQRAEDYREVVAALLLDAWVPDQLGGSGRRLPVAWLEGFAPGCPWWLAGGLSPGNVGEVLEQLQPDGLDASSGVELAPGDKDLARVAALVEAVKGSGNAAGGS